MKNHTYIHITTDLQHKMPTRIHTYIHAYIQYIYIYTYIYAYILNIYIYTYIHTDMYIQSFKHMHTYINTII